LSKKHDDRTNEWHKQQQILKDYRNKKLSTNTSEDTDKKQS